MFFLSITLDKKQSATRHRKWKELGSPEPIPYLQCNPLVFPQSRNPYTKESPSSNLHRNKLSSPDTQNPHTSDTSNTASLCIRPGDRAIFRSRRWGIEFHGYLPKNIWHISGIGRLINHLTYSPGAPACTRPICMENQAPAGVRCTRTQLALFFFLLCRWGGAFGAQWAWWCPLRGPGIIELSVRVGASFSGKVWEESAWFFGGIFRWISFDY